MTINKQTFEFLKWLEKFNNKKFFELYRPLYLDIKTNFELFVKNIIDNISKFDDELTWLEAKKCIYRIYKDMRFPKNRETPYKTNLWANISFYWKKFLSPWYYIHLENNNNFFWGWAYFLEAESTNKIRKYIYNHWDKFQNIINNKDFKKTFWKINHYRQTLKRLPKDFDINHPSIEYLRFKDRIIHKNISNSDVLKNDFDKKIIKYSKIAYPLKEFFNEAIV